MIAVYFGRDDFTAHEALEALRSELDTDGMLADNTTRLEGASAKPDELLSFCQTVPLLGGHRLIIVRGLLGRFETARRPRRRKASSKQKPAEGALSKWQPLIEALPALPESTALVFIDGELRPQNPMLQALRPVAQVREFKPMQSGELAGWITRRAQQYGASLEARAVAALAALVGDQLWTLDSELRKLATYGGDRQVTEEDVRSVVSFARKPTVFAMADAVIEGRTRDAVDLVQRLLAEGESPQGLLVMVARQYRLLLLTKELLERRVRPPEISARLRVQGFVIQRLLKQAPAYNIDQLRRAYRRLLEADLSVKRGVYDDETALHLLLFELAALRAGPTPRDGRQGYGRPPAGRGSAPSAAARG